MSEHNLHDDLQLALRINSKILSISQALRILETHPYMNWFLGGPEVAAEQTAELVAQLVITEHPQLLELNTYYGPTSVKDLLLLIRRQNLSVVTAPVVPSTPSPDTPPADTSTPSPASAPQTSELTALKQESAPVVPAAPTSGDPTSGDPTSGAPTSGAPDKESTVSKGVSGEDKAPRKEPKKAKAKDTAAKNTAAKDTAAKDKIELDPEIRSGLDLLLNQGHSEQEARKMVYEKLREMTQMTSYRSSVSLINVVMRRRTEQNAVEVTNRDERRLIKKALHEIERSTPKAAPEESKPSEPESTLSPLAQEIELKMRGIPVISVTQVSSTLNASEREAAEALRELSNAARMIFLGDRTFQWN